MAALRRVDERTPALAEAPRRVHQQPAARPGSVRLIAAALLAVAALSGCGGGSNGSAGAEAVTPVLDFFSNADPAGIYVAQARGEFRHPGPHARLKTPPPPPAPPQPLAPGGGAPPI